MWPLWSRIIEWILTAVIILGNGLVIYLITTKRNLRTTTNWFVFSLAVADFGVGATYALPYIVCGVYKNCDRHDKSLVILIGISFLYASLTNLCALTLDRYLAIVKPLRYVTFMTKKRVALLLFTAWSVPVSVLCSYLATFLATSGETYDLIKRSFWKSLAFLALFVCALLLFATARIFLVARRIAKQNAALNAQLNFNHRIQHRVAFKARESASAKMVGIVVATFVVCYSLHIVDTIMRLLLSSPPNQNLHILFILLTLINSGVNPVVYALLKREYRKELKRLLCPTKQKLQLRNGS